MKRLFQRDNTREHLHRTGQREEIEHDLIASTQCQCNMTMYDASHCHCQARDGHFLLAQFYYDLEQYDQAWSIYSKIQHVDLRGRDSMRMNRWT
jgi:hypothetical protein